VAIKLLQPGHTGHDEGEARFRAEARFAGSLSHPGITQVYDYREDDWPDPPYLVMELVDGPSLATTLADGPLEPVPLMDLIAQTAEALQAAHAAGVLHRDVKPGNLLVASGGKVKLTDFGIAQAAGSAPITRAGMLMGTAAYMAPERAAGGMATPASDLYALGIVAYQCLTGRVPFDGPPLAVALAHLERPPLALPPSVPDEAAVLVTDLTAKDPKARPATAAHVAERARHLHAALAAEPSAIPQGGRPESRSDTVATAPSGRPPSSWRADDHDGRRATQRRPMLLAALPGLAVLIVLIAAVITVRSVVPGDVDGPESGTGSSAAPAVTQQPSPEGSHWPSHALPTGKTGSARTLRVQATDRASTASSNPRASGTTPSSPASQLGSPIPVPAISGSPSPEETVQPSDTPTLTEGPAPSESQTPSETPSASPVSG
jgi:serine/threonine-protein kinase